LRRGDNGGKKKLAQRKDEENNMAFARKGGDSGADNAKGIEPTVKGLWYKSNKGLKMQIKRQIHFNKKKKKMV